MEQAVKILNVPNVPLTNAAKFIVYPFGHGFTSVPYAKLITSIEIRQQTSQRFVIEDHLALRIFYAAGAFVCSHHRFMVAYIRLIPRSPTIDRVQTTHRVV